MKKFGLVLIFFALTGTVRAQSTLEAEQFVRQKDWARAAEAYRRIVEINPYNGKFWYRLGQIHRNLKQWDQSTEAYSRAVELGFVPGFSMYNIACNYAQQNKPREAVACIEKAIAVKKGVELEHMLADADLAPIRQSPEFQALLGPTVPEGVSREEGWKIDIDHLDRQLRRLHFNLFHQISESEWKAEINRLKSLIPKSTDRQLVVETMRLVAKVGDGHTSVMPPLFGKCRFHKIPAWFGEFREGTFIVSAATEYKKAVGGKVLKIGKSDIADVRKRIIELLPKDKGNEEVMKFIGVFYYSCPDVLSAFGAVDSVDEVPLTIVTPEGKREVVTFKSEPLDPASVEAGGDTPDFVRASDGADKPLPLHRKNPNEVFWFEYLPEHKIVYAQINQIQAKGNETLGDFGKQLRAFIDAGDVEALILDIRNNNGGNNMFNQAFVHELIKCEKINQRGKLFTVIGSRTFSAAMNLAADLETHTRTLFVGMPTGSSPNHIGDHNFFMLPYGNLRVSAACAYWQARNSFDERKWIAPDLIAEPTFEAYRQNRDVALETVLEFLKRSGTKKDP